jgi:hypothetical protein
VRPLLALPIVGHGDRRPAAGRPGVLSSRVRFRIPRVMSPMGPFRA